MSFSLAFRVGFERSGSKQLRLQYVPTRKLTEASVSHTRRCASPHGRDTEGGQLTSYMQLAKLTYALGGAIVMDGFPLPPLVDMPGAPHAAAKRNASYYGDDVRFMIYQVSNE